METLHILWTTDNKVTVSYMLFMYALNAKRKGWWEKVNVIIWGASASLVGNDPEVQEGVLELLRNDIQVEACKACADHLGVTDTLARLGINVRYMGEPLTRYLKSGDKILNL